MSKAQKELLLWIAKEVLVWVVSISVVITFLFSCRTVKKNTEELKQTEVIRSFDTTTTQRVKKEEGKTVANDRGSWGRLIVYPGGKIPDSIRKKISLNPIADSILKYNQDAIIDFSYGEYNKDLKKEYTKSDSSIKKRSKKFDLDKKVEKKVSTKDTKNGGGGIKLTLIIGAVLAAAIGIFIFPKLSPLFAVAIAKVTGIIKRKK